MADAFLIFGDRRARADEVKTHIASTMGRTAVHGFEELVSCAGIEGRDPIAAFMESWEDREWYLPLSADGPLVWKTQPVPAEPLEKVAFVFGVGFGNGSPMAQPSGKWDIYVNDRFALSVRVVKHSFRWTSDDCEFAFSAHRIDAARHQESIALSAVLQNESFAAFGPAMLTVPREWLTPGESATIRVEPWCRGPSTRWFMLAPVASVFENGDVYRLMNVAAGKHPTAHGMNIYFGDIHTHSGQVCDRPEGGCGTGSREENYAYARGPAGLDFYCLSDHEAQVDPEKIEDFLALADAHETPGQFVCLRGFEFTSLVYGHRNIYFRDKGGTIVNACKDWHSMTRDYANATTPAELWEALEACGDPFISVPHHPSAASHPFDWNQFNPKYERLVEVYSMWGSSEYYGDTPRGGSDRYPDLFVRNALNRGLRFGLIASSDGHDGQPGNAQGRPRDMFTRHGGSGWVAVLCDDLTRENVWDALYDRRCYATTGVPIGLSFAINGSIMGTELPAFPAGEKPELAIGCEGCNGIDHIRIVKNGRVVHTEWCHGEHRAEFIWTDHAYDPNETSYYYVRVVQVDLESAWSSPIWIG
jgi:hypothetical protein